MYGGINENKNRGRKKKRETAKIGFPIIIRQLIFARRIFWRDNPVKGDNDRKDTHDLWLSARGGYPSPHPPSRVDAKDNRKCLETHAIHTNIACIPCITRVHFPSILLRWGSVPPPKPSLVPLPPPWTSGLEDPPTGRRGRRNAVKFDYRKVNTRGLPLSLSVSRSLSLSPGRRHRCRRRRRRRRHGRMYLQGYHVERRVRIPNGWREIIRRD